MTFDGHIPPGPDETGWVSFYAGQTINFTSPNFETDMELEIWGGGTPGGDDAGTGGTSGAYSRKSLTSVPANTVFSGTVANQNGTTTLTCASPLVSMSASTTASGGDTNTAGVAGSGSSGGTAPSSVLQGPDRSGGAGGVKGSKNNDGTPGQYPAGGGGPGGKNGAGANGAAGRATLRWKRR